MNNNRMRSHSVDHQRKGRTGGSGDRWRDSLNDASEKDCSSKHIKRFLCKLIFDFVRLFFPYISFFTRNCHFHVTMRFKIICYDSVSKSVADWVTLRPNRIRGFEKAAYWVPSPCNTHPPICVPTNKWLMRSGVRQTRAANGWQKHWAAADEKERTILIDGPQLLLPPLMVHSHAVNTVQIPREAWERGRVELAIMTQIQLQIGNWKRWRDYVFKKVTLGWSYDALRWCGESIGVITNRKRTNWWISFKAEEIWLIGRIPPPCQECIKMWWMHWNISLLNCCGKYRCCWIAKIIYLFDQKLYIEKFNGNVWADDV